MKRATLGLLLLGLTQACDCGEGGLANVFGDIEVEPRVIAFGDVSVGTVGRVTLQVKNVGAVSLQVTDVRLTDNTHPAVSVDTSTFEVGAGAVHEVVVSFEPTEPGAAFGAVVISSDDPDESEVTVPIEANGTRREGPAIAVCVEGDGIARTCGTDLSVAFGDVLIGGAAQANVDITSVGTVPVTITSAALTMDSHASYTATPSDLATTLAPMESATIVVRHAPVDASTEGATLQVLSSDPDAPTSTVRFEATGVTSGLCLSDEAIDFGVVAIGAFEDRDLTIENCGDDVIELGELTIEMDPEFTIESAPALPHSLDVGATVTVTLRYTPTDSADDRDRLRIGSDAPTAYVSLLGRAASCQLSALPPSIDFSAVPVGGSRNRTLVLTNAGTSPCEVSAVELGTNTSAEFTIVTTPTLPATIGPGATTNVDLEYTPADAGMDNGELVITSNDTTTTRLVVPLTGRRLGVGECGLTVTPDPVTFGAVPFGSSVSQTVTIENTGGSACTISVLRMSVTSSLEFLLESGMVPDLLLAGQTKTVTLTFEPRSVQMAMGEIEIFTGLIPTGAPDYTVPVSGGGVGARLCAEPNPVVFGTHPPTTVTQRTVNMYACGNEDVVISSLALPAPTTPEVSMYMPPSLPLTIPAGQAQLLELRYVGTDEGRDDGVLRIDSNDALAPTQDIDLIAHTSAGPCGDIQGKICDLTMSGPVDGATVYVDTPGGRITTTTNANGDYVLTCVPVGGHNVHAEKGQWSTTFPATVNAYSTTVIPGQQCLDPSSANVAVIYGEYDQMEQILATMSVPYDFYMDTASLTQNATLLATYDIVFINCGWDEFAGLTNTSRTNLSAFVANGGSLYASDWSYDIIEVLWPNAIDFHGDDTVRDAAQNAGNFSGLVDITDASLSATLGGRTQIPITSCCTAMTTAGAGTTTYLEGARLGGMTAHPFMAGFAVTPTSGRVFYTDFHNNGQADIAGVFRWLILNL